jgi:hypothetical protein
MQIADLVINETVRFIKRYPEYVLDKVGTLISINVEDGIVLVRTDDRTIYKLVFMETEFSINDKQLVK